MIRGKDRGNRPSEFYHEYLHLSQTTIGPSSSPTRRLPRDASYAGPWDSAAATSRSIADAMVYGDPVRVSSVPASHFRWISYTALRTHPASQASDTVCPWSFSIPASSAFRWTSPRIGRPAARYSYTLDGIVSAEKSSTFWMRTRTSESRIVASASRRGTRPWNVTTPGTGNSRSRRAEFASQCP